MWFDILLLARGIGLGDISQALSPVYTRVNVIFSTSGYSVKLSVCWSVCIFHYFLKKIIIFSETLQEPL